jgi:hypothetical protein
VLLITAVVKVSTYIIINITARPIGLIAVLVGMSVSIFVLTVYMINMVGVL